MHARTATCAIVAAAGNDVALHASIDPFPAPLTPTYNRDDEPEGMTFIRKYSLSAKELESVGNTRSYCTRARRYLSVHARCLSLLC